jgi:hypothetical protein
MNSKTSPRLADEFASLVALYERADREEGRMTSPRLASPGLPGVPLSQLIEPFTGRGRAKLLAAVQAHPIYRRLTADVPRVVTVPGESPFDPLRRGQSPTAWHSPCLAPGARR